MDLAGQQVPLWDVYRRRGQELLAVGKIWPVIRGEWRRKADGLLVPPPPPRFEKPREAAPWIEDIAARYRERAQVETLGKLLHDDAWAHFMEHKRIWVLAPAIKCLGMISILGAMPQNTVLLSLEYHVYWGLCTNLGLGQATFLGKDKFPLYNILGLYLYLKRMPAVLVGAASVAGPSPLDSGWRPPLDNIVLA